MPNQKTNKGKRNKRTNSSGDEQENGTTASGGAQGGATALSGGAAVGPCQDNRGGKE